MKKNNDTITVYWSMRALPDQITKTNLMWKPPVPFFSMMPKSKKDMEYVGCMAMKNFFKNTYMLIHPANSTIHFNIENNKLTMTMVEGLPAWFGKEDPVFFDRHRMIYDFQWIFFSEDELTMEIIPPFLHETEDKKGGVIGTGSFDISKWFRPINPDYILWNGVNSLSVKKGDPAFYIRFVTNKKIIFKQFDMSQELDSISDQIVNHKVFFPKEPLHILYNRFISSNRHKRILKLIKQNLLE